MSGCQLSSRRFRGYVSHAVALMSFVEVVGCGGRVEVDTGRAHSRTLEFSAVASPLIVGETTPERPFAVFSHALQNSILTWVGQDHHINVVQKNANTGEWSKDKRTLGDTVADSGGVAIAELNGRVYVAWNGTDTRLNLISSADGLVWDQKRTLAFHSERGPALTAHDGRLYLAYTSESDTIQVVSWDGLADSEESDSFSTLETTENGPSLTSFSGHLLLGWTGTDMHLNVLEWDANSMSPRMKATFPDVSERGCVLQGLGSELLLGWTGTDEHLNVAAIEECSLLEALRNGGGGLTKTTLADTSRRGLTLANLDESAAVLWAGTDGRVNITEGIRGATPDVDPDSSEHCVGTAIGHVVPTTLADAAAEGSLSICSDLNDLDTCTGEPKRILRLVASWLQDRDKPVGQRTEGVPDGLGNWEDADSLGFRLIQAGFLAQKIVDANTVNNNREALRSINPDLDRILDLAPADDFSQVVEDWLTLFARQHNGIGTNGEFDFHLSHAMNLLYGFGPRPGVQRPDGSRFLTDRAVRSLLFYHDSDCRGSLDACRDFHDACVPDLGKTVTCQGTPLAGSTRVSNLSAPFFDVLGIEFSTPETENHVLMVNASRYLANQWVRENPAGDPILTAMRDANPAAFENDGSMLEAALLSILSRFTKNGYFEENARPYGGYTLRILMTLAAHASSERVKSAALNAVDFSATLVAFQSLYGKRYAPMRRQWHRRNQNRLYDGDYVMPMFGILTGAYSFNDDPVCTTPDCLWSTSDQYRGFALNAVVSGYTVPAAIHHFMLHPDNESEGFGAYSQIATRYSAPMYALNEPARYPAPNVMGDPDLDAMARSAQAGIHAYQDAREQYFLTATYLNSSGGHFDPWFLSPEMHDFLEGATLDILTEFGFLSDKLHDVDFLSRPSTLLSSGPVVWNSLGEAFTKVPMMPGITWCDYALDIGGDEGTYCNPNGPVYKNVAVGWSGLGSSPASIPDNWSLLSQQELSPGVNATVFAGPTGPAGSQLKLVVVNLESDPFSGLWEVVPEHVDSSDLLERLAERNDGLNTDVTTTFKYRTVMSGELLEFAVSGLPTNILTLTKIDEEPTDIHSSAQSAIINTPLMRVRQTDANYEFTGVEYVRADADGVVTINNPKLGSTLTLDSRDPLNPTRLDLSPTQSQNLRFGESWFPPILGSAELGSSSNSLRLTPNAGGSAQIQTQVIRETSTWALGGVNLKAVVNGLPSANARLRLKLGNTASGAIQLGATMRLRDVQATGGGALNFNTPASALQAIHGNTAPLTITIELLDAAGVTVDLSELRTSTYRTVPTGQGRIGKWDEQWITSAPSSLVGSGTVGSVGQAVCGEGYRTLESQSFNPKDFSWNSQRIALDVFVPANPSNPQWLGAVQLYYLHRATWINQYLGQVELTGFTPGEWSTVTFALPASALEELSKDKPGSSFQVAINANQSANGQCFVLDNLRYLGPLSLNALPVLGPSIPTSSLTLATRVFGFESTQSWHALRGPSEPTLVTQSVTGGRYALQVPVSGWTLIESELFLTSDLTTSGSRLELDIVAPLPANPYWLGEVAAYLECPRANLWNQWIGQVPVPATVGTPTSVSWPLPVELQQALEGDNECLLRLSFNAPQNAGSFVVDSFRLAP